MTTDQILLLGSIVVPAFVSIILFSGIGRNESIVKNLAYIGFGFPFISGILLFLHFDGSSGGYCFEIFHPRMGLHELKITFFSFSPLFNWWSSLPSGLPLTVELFVASLWLMFAEPVLLKLCFCSEFHLTGWAGLELVCPRPPPVSTPLAGWWEGWENPDLIGQVVPLDFFPHLVHYE